MQGGAGIGVCSPGQAPILGVSSPLPVSPAQAGGGAGRALQHRGTWGLRKEQMREPKSPQNRPLLTQRVGRTPRGCAGRAWASCSHPALGRAFSGTFQGRPRQPPFGCQEETEQDTLPPRSTTAEGRAGEGPGQLPSWGLTPVGEGDPRGLPSRPQSCCPRSHSTKSGAGCKLRSGGLQILCSSDSRMLPTCLWVPGAPLLKQHSLFLSRILMRLNNNCH